jgi:hypothetical protein
LPTGVAKTDDVPQLMKVDVQDVIGIFLALIEDESSPDDGHTGHDFPRGQEDNGRHGEPDNSSRHDGHLATSLECQVDMTVRLRSAVCTA